VAEFERVDRSNADLIVGVDNTVIDTVDDFLTAIESKNPGDQVLIAVERQGHHLDVPLTLEAERNN
jgi:S1-C subfamily serine protease